MVVVAWLADDCARQAAAAPDIDYYSERAGMLWGLTSLLKIWRESPMFLSPARRRACLEPRDVFFGLYTKLSTLASEFERPLYGMIPKHHMLDHLVRHCCETGLNPCSYWCFQDEDAMRLCMGIAEHSKQGTVDRFSLNRWCLQFFSTDSSAPAPAHRGWKRQL